MRYFFSILILLSLGFESKAQVFPPDFQCVRNDTLFWELPVNPCGTFNSYDILFSDNVNGPYTLLEAVTDPTAISYFHNNPTGETFYYYLQTDANCPGVPILNSDTLNNESPEQSPIIVVSVNGDDVEISWNSSPSPEVTNYIIYRNSSLGTLPIDTVDASVNSYIDVNADPSNQGEIYFVIALDACGNTSVFALPHFTIFLESQVDVCNQSIQLDWNRYRNWVNGIGKQELWVSVNNSSFVLLEELPAADSTYLFTDTNDGDNYCFFIMAEEQATSIQSFSNAHCLDLNIVEPVRKLFLKNASVNDANQTELTWQWNNDAEVDFVDFFQKAEGGNFDNINSFNPGPSLTTQVTRTLDNSDPAIGKRYYQIQSTDDCDSSKVSNEASTIHLVGIAQANQTNLLNWTAFERTDGVIDNYDIYRIVDGVRSYTASVDGSSTFYTDLIDISDPNEATVCYQVIANAQVTDSEGNEMTIASQSNTSCVEQLSNILAPNAFAPEGFNKEFKPRIVFGETVDYSLQIFDRWGKQIFESADQDRGWTGQDGFFYYPAGVYVYIIQITQTNGRTVEKKGNVVLIR